MSQRRLIRARRCRTTLHLLVASLAAIASGALRADGPPTGYIEFYHESGDDPIDLFESGEMIDGFEVPDGLCLMYVSSGIDRREAGRNGGTLCRSASFRLIVEPGSYITDVNITAETHTWAWCGVNDPVEDINPYSFRPDPMIAVSSCEDETGAAWARSSLRVAHSPSGVVVEFQTEVTESGDGQGAAVVLLGFECRAVSTTGEPVRVRLVPDVPEDINFDGCVDTADLGALLGSFGASGPFADVNEDGIVDTADLGRLIAQFGTLCP